MYHRFNEGKYSSTNIQMSIFEEHINNIKSSGYEFLKPNLFSKVFFEEKPKKQFLLTIDDGYKTISVHGMFVAIGHVPATAAFVGEVALDDEGYIIAEAGGTRTSVDGVFAAGDCVDKIYRQAVTAAGMGCMAALDAEKWIQSHNL